MQDESKRAVNLLQFWLDVQAFKALSISTSNARNSEVDSSIGQVKTKLNTNLDISIIILIP